jgi:hypothetical protein
MAQDDDVGHDHDCYLLSSPGLGVHPIGPQMRDSSAALAPSA